MPNIAKTTANAAPVMPFLFLLVLLERDVHNDKSLDFSKILSIIITYINVPLTFKL